MQIVLKNRSNKSVEGKLSFIDLAGSERGADRGETDVKTRYVMPNNVWSISKYGDWNPVE